MIHTPLAFAQFGSLDRFEFGGYRTRNKAGRKASGIFIGLAILGLASSPAFANSDWIYEQEITITSTRATDAAGFQVLIELNPGNFDYSHANANGSDIRFASTAASETFDIAHFVETWMPGGESRIWARIPNVPAAGTMSIFLRFGNPAATTTSDFATTFPNAFVSSGAAELGGAQNFDWFEVKAGDTLTVTAGAALEVTARNVIVAGTVDANGAGFATNGNSSAGSGPGAGTTSPNSGCGGGSYGGSGGSGGFDLGDTPGTGGPLYETADGTDYALGSSGGSSSINLAGNGGGAIVILAQDMAVAGTLRSDGGDAGQPGGGQGGGGGSGGTIVLTGFRLTVTGTLSAKGGSGSIGTSTANDDGGGGGGGRIKLFGEDTLDNTGSLDVNGGPAGTNGSEAPPEAGGVGTTHSDTVSVDFEEITAAVGPEVELELKPAIIAKPKRFKATLVGKKSRPQRLRMTNPGALALNAISARTRGGAARDFRVTVPATTLAPGASMDLGITFKPSQRGSRKTKLIVSSNVSSATLRLIGLGK